MENQYSYERANWRDLEWPQADALITDPPYSDRVHKGARSNADPGSPSVDYSHLSPGDAWELAERFAPLIHNWAIIFCDHVAHRLHAQAWEAAGWYVFAPVGWVKARPCPRMSGDGPTASIEWIMVARPRRRVEVTGSRAGHYMVGNGRQERRGDRRAAGHKDPRDLANLIAQYTQPGDLVLDPYAGTATVGAAAIAWARHYHGAEVDADTHEAGVARLESLPRPLPGLDQFPMFKQADLF